MMLPTKMSVRGFAESQRRVERREVAHGRDVARRLPAALLAAVMAVTAPLGMQSSLARESSPATQAATTRQATTLAAAATAPATTRATTAPVARRPTPAELIEQMKARQREIDALPKVAMIELSGAVTERPSPGSLFGGGGGTTLLSLLDRLKAAREDKAVRALVIVLSADTSMGLSQAAELRDALAEFRKAGKRVFVYADSYDTVSYTLASGASDIVLLEGGELFMPGIGLESQFYKGLMDKVGVKGDYVQIGEYKGAEEPYTRSEPSEQLRGEMNKLAEGLYTQITAGIAKGRGLPVEVVRQAVDDAMIPARSARDRKLVDHLADRDALRKLVEDELNTKKINVVSDYGEDDKPELDVSNPFAFLAAISRKPAPPTKDTIAVVYAEGTIVDGEGGGGGLPIPGLGSGPSVGSEDIRKAMKSARDNPLVKAVVIRIDSPGGSALASEVMWQAVRKTAAEKPVIISIGGMAASGGYYLASAGDEIIAEPSAIIGSIGVVGGKFVLKGLFDKLGITSESFLKGRNADLFSSSTEWSDRQRRMVGNMMRATYDQFTDRIMTTRRGKIADIDQVARGRIFVAADTVKLGMVDELGGLSHAISRAADRAELKPGEFEIRSYPEPRGLADLLGGVASSGAMPIPTASVSESSVLRLLSPGQRKTLGQQLQFIQLLQERPVILATPFSITIR